MTDYSKFLVVFLLSFLTCAILVVSRRYYMPRLRPRGDLSACQALHCDETPRLGGIGIMLAMTLAMTIMPQSLERLFGIFALSLAPVVFTGLAEDLGYRVSPKGRLFAAVVSSLVMITALSVWIPPSSGIAVIDFVLQFAIIAVPLTVLWATGICHGFNLIDGVNGLSAGLALMIATGLWWIADASGARELALLSAALIPALLGFMLFNWPYGRIFLGDAGAYGIGHLLVWFAILLAWALPDISILALALMFFWPVADTFLAIWRRRYLGAPVDAPDRLHFHQFVFRILAQTVGKRMSARAVNSLTGLVLLPLAGMPVVAAVVLRDAPYLAAAAWVGFGILFVVCYVWGIAQFRGRKFRGARPEFHVHPAE